MGLIQNSVSVAAGATNSNLISGSAFEFLPFDATIEIGLLASATGVLAGVSSGSDILLEDGSLVNVVTTANQGPRYPDDFQLTDEALAGDRLRIAIRNPTAGAVTVFYSVRTTPI